MMFGIEVGGRVVLVRRALIHQPRDRRNIDAVVIRLPFGEGLANVMATIETILASKPFDIARFAVAQGTLGDLAVM